MISAGRILNLAGIDCSSDFNWKQSKRRFFFFKSYQLKLVQEKRKCVRERERERESACMHVCVCVCARAG